MSKGPDDINIILQRYTAADANGCWVWQMKPIQSTGYCRIKRKGAASENQRRGTSPVSANAFKTHCLRGHELSGENLFIRRDGRRRCRTCERTSQRRLRALPQQKAKRNASIKTPTNRAKRAAYERARRQHKKENCHADV